MADATKQGDGDLPGYIPEKVWSAPTDDSGKLAGMNRPTAGARSEKALPVGEHPLQLHSMATPNGVKVTVMLEELLLAGHKADYDAWPINIMAEDQFSSGFVDINPNSKIPALLDTETNARVWESASILLYLSEKFGGAFVPKGLKEKTECMNWVFWTQGSAPYVGGGFGHFYKYAPIKIKYAIDRYAMETKRQLDVLDKHLSLNKYLAGDEYSIADMCAAPWYGPLVTMDFYDQREYLDTQSYTHVARWAEDVMERPAFKAGLKINKFWGPEADQQPEKH
jgi:GST-like protein